MTVRYSLSDDALAALQAGDPAALIDSHRARFGGWRMEDDGNSGDDPEGAGAEDDHEDDSGEGTEDDAEDDGAGESDARIRRARKQAAGYREELRTTQAQLQQTNSVLDALRKALDPNAGDNDPDPAKLTGQVESLTNETAQLRAELLVHELSAEHKANPVALLDSRRFTDSLGKLDAAADDYRDQVATAIKEAVKKNANLRATGQVQARGGASNAGQGSDDAGAVTQEQFDAMDLGERNKLFRSNPDLYRRLAASIR